MAIQGQLVASNGVLRLRVGAWVCVLALGMLHLYYPLHGDQALFLYYAGWLDRGAVLYVDLWDNKQPGVFWFFGLAGKLFGFTSVSVHLLELFWVLGAAVVLTWVATRSFANRLAAELTPLLTAGLYYWCAGSWFLTQIEILVSLPLAACALVSLVALRRPYLAWRMHALFALFAAIVATFKLVLAVVPLAMWLVLVSFQLAKAERNARALLVGILVPAIFGAALPLSLVALHSWASGSWDAFVWTNFNYPRLALQEVAGKSFGKFLAGSTWLVRVAVPALPLLWLAVADLRREGVRLIEAQAMAWIIAGVAAILVQRFSYWSYHFVLLLFPLGVLVASAIDRFLIRFGGRRSAVSDRHLRWAGIVTVVAMFAFCSNQGLLGLRAAAAALAAPAGDRISMFRRVIDPKHEVRANAFALLRSEIARARTIYVFGNPNWLLEARRPQAIPIHGWGWEVMLSGQWLALPAQLSTAKPEYIYVDSYYAGLIAKRSPGTWQIIASDYVPAAPTDEGGIWYRRRDPSSM